MDSTSYLASPCMDWAANQCRSQCTCAGRSSLGRSCKRTRYAPHRPGSALRAPHALLQSADKVADRTSVLSRSGRDAVAGPELATGHAPFARARTRDAMARPELATDRAPRTHMRTLAAPASAPAPALALAASEPTGPAREPSAGIQHRAARGTAVPALNLDLTRSQPQVRVRHAFSQMRSDSALAFDWPQSGRAVRTGGFC